jgi:hypothetical protein
MQYVILALVALLLLRAAVAVRHHPSPARILMLLFWMAVFAYSLVPAPAIFGAAVLLVALSFAARMLPERARVVAAALGLPAVEEVLPLEAGEDDEDDPTDPTTPPDSQDPG